jgi:tetratricopeptide (TPR) repeat protein
LKKEPARRQRVVPVLLAVLLIGGCASTPKVDTGEQKAKALQAEATRLIEIASIRSLEQAATILMSPALDGSAKARTQLSLAADLFRKLYPEASSPYPHSTPAPGKDAINESAFFLQVMPGLVLLVPGESLEESVAANLKARLSSASRLNPDSVLPPYLLGLLLERQGGDPAAARALFEESLRRGPDFYPAGVKIAQIIIQGGTPRTGAASPVAGAAFIPAAELPLLTRLAALLPTQTLRLAALAHANLAAGQPQAAADAAAQGLLSAPNDPQFFLLRAQAVEALGNWYQALALLDTLLKVKPDQPQALLMKARLLYEKQQNSEEAIAVLRDAEARFPSDASFPELQGRILLETGRSDEGVSVLTIALSMEPGRVSTLVLLLRQAIQTQSWTTAAELLTQMPDKTLTPDLLRLAWEVETNLGDSARAIAYAQALERAESGASPLALEARSLVAAGQIDKAKEVVTRALAVADTPALRSELLYLRSTAGSDDPMRDLRSALLVNPENQEALIAISDLFAQQQDYRKAAAYARQAAELSPQSASLAQKAAELQKRAELSSQ